MKALTLHQPWASAIQHEFKQYETRSRKTNHRGLIAIHAGKAFNPLGLVPSVDYTDKIERPLTRRYAQWDEHDFPSGAVVAIANLTDCIEMTEEFIAAQSLVERELGDWAIGRYAYRLEAVQPLLKPFSCAGKQGLWNCEVPEEYLEGITLPEI